MTLRREEEVHAEGAHGSPVHVELGGVLQTDLQRGAAGLSEQRRAEQLHAAVRLEVEGLGGGRRVERHERRPAASLLLQRWACVAFAPIRRQRRRDRRLCVEADPVDARLFLDARAAKPATGGARAGQEDAASPPLACGAPSRSQTTRARACGQAGLAHLGLSRQFLQRPQSLARQASHVPQRAFLIGRRGDGSVLGPSALPVALSSSALALASGPSGAFSACGLPTL